MIKLRIIFYLLLLPLLIGSFTIIINPFDQWNIPRITGLNDKITETRWDLLIKSFQIRHAAFDTIILGSSRAAVAFPEQHAAFKTKSTYNYGLSGAGIYVQYLALQHALATQPIKTIIITPDFFGFNANLKLNQPTLNGHSEVEKLFSPGISQYMDDSFSNTFSWRGANSSLRTLISQDQPTVYMDRHGFWNHFGAKDKNFEEQYNRNERVFLTELIFPSPKKQFTFSDAQTGYDSFTIFKKMLVLAHEKSIDVHIIILPTPTRDLLALQELGEWGHYREWKENLAHINEEAAAQLQTPPFPLWDFEHGQNQLNSDALIDQKPFFFEPFHPTPLTGERILNRVFLDCTSVECWPGNFLTASTVDATLKQLEQDLTAYRSRNKQQMTALMNNIHKTERYRQSESRE